MVPKNRFFLTFSITKECNPFYCSHEFNSIVFKLLSQVKLKINFEASNNLIPLGTYQNITGENLEVISAGLIKSKRLSLKEQPFALR